MKSAARLISHKQLWGSELWDDVKVWRERVRRASGERLRAHIPLLPQAICLTSQLTEDYLRCLHVLSRAYHSLAGGWCNGQREGEVVQ